MQQVAGEKTINTWMVYLVTDVCYDDLPPLHLAKVCGKSPTILSLCLLM